MVVSVSLSAGGDWMSLPATRIEWQSSAIGRAAFVEVSYLSILCKLEPGARIILKDAEGNICFMGFVFETKEGNDISKVRAYDQIRYLMFKDTYAFDQKSVSQIVMAIAKDMGLSLGTLTQTSFVFDLICQEKKLLDIIYQAIELHRQHTGQVLMLLDLAGKICLQKQSELSLGFSITPENMITGYNVVDSIDKKTFNRIKLAQKDKKKSLRTVNVIQDGATAAAWGTLQLYQRVDEKMSQTQIQELGKALLQQHNQMDSSISIHALGNARCRAGFSVQVEVPGFGGSYLIEKAQHQIAGDRHEMQLILSKLK